MFGVVKSKCLEGNNLIFYFGNGWHGWYRARKEVIPRGHNLFIPVLSVGKELCQYRHCVWGVGFVFVGLRIKIE
jgi:hypothetical protein